MNNLKLLRAGNEREPPLILIHPHSGTLIVYNDFVRRYPGGRPIFGLQSSGLDGKSEVRQSIENMARAYANEVRGRFPTGPCLLAGYCMGGTIAWELARQMEADGGRVAFVGMIQCIHSKHTIASIRSPTLWDRLDALTNLVHDIVPRHLGSVQQAVLLAKTAVGEAARAVSRRLVRDTVKIPPDPALLRVYEANGEAFLNHTPRRLSVPVGIYRGLYQPRSARRDPSLGWGELADGPIVTREYAGSVFGNMTGDFDVEGCARGLERDAAEALAGDERRRLELAG